MSSIPIVVVSATVRRDPNTAPFVRLRATYLAALENARLIPLITSPVRNESGAESLAESLLQRVDGLVLTGGEDVNPARFGASPHPKLGSVSDERDTWELDLVRTAARLCVPTLAICRGMQVVNVALGGTLIQDIPSEHTTRDGNGYGGGIDHDPDLPRSNRSHPVAIDSDSRTGRAIGVTQLRVNSVHHQAIERVGSTLRVVATAPDGVIEAVESPPDPAWWCVGVQWHPEDLVESREAWERSLFAAFGDAVRARRDAASR